jgi:hypothetical protein
MKILTNAFKTLLPFFIAAINYIFALRHI